MPRISTPARLGRVLFVLFVLFGLLGVVAAHHDNEAEHQVTAAAAANSGQSAHGSASTCNTFDKT